MRPPVTYDTKHPLDDQWPVEVDCRCWSLRLEDMPMMPICAVVKPDGRVVMRNVRYPEEDVIEEDIWCGTCRHAGVCHW